MTCRQSFEIDLLGFLEAPRSAGFAAFRDHYPRCRECAAEVRSWTELHEQLAARAPDAGHLAPDVLARYEDAPGELAPPERARVELHLGRCAACRDELRALGRFAPEAPGPSGSETRPAPQPARLRRWLAGLGRLAWSPAFAYTLVGLLLLPLVYQRREPDGLRSALPAPGESPTTAEVAPAPAEKRVVDLADEASTQLPAARMPSAGRREISPGAEAAGSRAKVETERLVQERFGRAFALGPGPPRSDRAEPEGGHDFVGIAPGRDAAVPAALAAAGPRLRFELPPGAAGAGGEALIRIVSADGRRELRERVALRAGESWAELRIPPGWLSRGRHLAEVGLAERSPLLYRFEVH